MPLIRRFRRRAGALLYDQPRFEATLRGIGPYRRLPWPWVAMHNRNERITLDGRGARCEWIYGSDLHIANVFPSAATRLMRRAFRDWPIVLSDAPPATSKPRVSFVIGHRGRTRLPHLAMTLRSIAGQQDVPIECIVVEQSAEREIERAVPGWVRYIHVPVADDAPYNRAATFNAGARAARGELLILHDNDILCPAAYVSEAVARSEEGWSFQQLKRFLFYLDATDTELLFATQTVRTDRATTIVQNVHGGSIAANRSAFFDIGGFDESFVGWGGEDNEFWDRAETSASVYDFAYLPFIHLWHEPQAGKLAGADAPAVRRWHELKNVPAAERIARLREGARG